MTHANATVTTAMQTGTVIGHDPVIEIGLTVIADGRPPYPATVTQPVSPLLLARLQVGSELHVQFDPADPARIRLALTDDADADAEIGA